MSDFPNGVDVSTARMFVAWDFAKSAVRVNQFDSYEDYHKALLDAYQVGLRRVKNTNSVETKDVSPAWGSA